MAKYTVKWNQEIVSGDIWRVGELRELTTDQFYWMETTYPGCLVPASEPADDLRIPKPSPPRSDRQVKQASTRAPARKPAAKRRS